MHENIKRYIYRTLILSLLTSLSTIVVSLVIFVGLKGEIDLVKAVLKTYDIQNETTEELAYMEIVSDSNKLIKNYPYYSKEYAKIFIPNVDISLPIFFGDSLEILKKGSGHMTSSYFPGEGSSIIIGAHHSKDKFGNLENVKLGDKVHIATTYGEFYYSVYDIKVIKETDLDMLPVQKEQEILMLYTCYPFGYLGYTTERYVVYAKLDSYDIY